MGKIAILYDNTAKLSPSNELAIKNFIHAANNLCYRAEIITKYDINRLSEFDILFIRETTSLTNHTYEFADKAEKLGLIVIDDTASMNICCDKAIQHEIFHNNWVPVPRSMIINRYSVNNLARLRIESPWVIKNPYGCFSNGVFKSSCKDEMYKFVEAMLEQVDKVVIQEFLETTYDWRIGILNNKMIYACKYFMSPGHWKVVKHDRSGGFVDGESECVAVSKVPRSVKEAALRAAKLVGTGLYGVDVKQMAGDAVYVIEINDNVSIDAGIEDQLLGDDLYYTIIHHLVSRHCARSLEAE